MSCKCTTSDLAPIEGLSPLWCRTCRCWKAPVVLVSREPHVVPMVIRPNYCEDCGARLVETY